MYFITYVCTYMFVLHSGCMCVIHTCIYIVHVCYTIRSFCIIHGSSSTDSPFHPEKLEELRRWCWAQFLIIHRHDMTSCDAHTMYLFHNIVLYSWSLKEVLSHKKWTGRWSSFGGPNRWIKSVGGPKVNPTQSSLVDQKWIWSGCG